LIHGRVIEVGVNYGNTAILAASWPEVTEVLAIDINANALRACEDLATKAGVAGKMTFQVVNWAEACWVFSAYDVFMCHHTLEHIFSEDVDAFVKNSANSLKRGGIALVTVPHLTCHNSPEHVVLYDEKKLAETFGRHGLVAESCRVYGGGSIDGIFRKGTE
jgi:cyclopropane fatty-acyl-phospholipid synthase-like methyltransferase